MSVSSPPALPTSLTAQPGPGARLPYVHSSVLTWGLALLCCIVSMFATAIYLKREFADARVAAEREMSVAAAIAGDEYGFVSQLMINAGAGPESDLNTRLSRIGDRVGRLAGMRAVFIDAEGAPVETPAMRAPGNPPPDLALDAAPLLMPSLPVALQQQLAVMLPGVMTAIPAIAGEPAYFGYVREMPQRAGAVRRIAILATEQEILSGYIALRRNAFAACAGFMLIVVTLSWAFARHLVRREAFESAVLAHANSLALQHAHLEETSRIAQVGHFYWDLANDSLEVRGDDNSIFGYAASQYFSTMAEWQSRFCPPEDLAAVTAARQQFVRRGEAYTVQRRTYTPDGKLRWLDIAAEPVRCSNGNVVAYRGAFRDITAQKQAELKLTESELKFRLISENMHDQVALHAPDGTILYASPSTTSLLGYDAKRSVGRSSFRALHPDDVARVVAAIDYLAGTPEIPSITTEYRYRHLDGHYLWLQSVVVAVRDADGSLLHFQTSTRDVTLRRNAEEQLRRSEERFRALTDISSDWYWETDEQHRFSFLSLQQTLLTQQSREEIIGRTRWELFPEAVKRGEWEEHRKTLDARRPFQGLILRINEPGRENGIGYFSLSGRPIFSNEGTFLGYRGIGRDISKFKLNEQQLAESEERYRLITQNMRDLVSLHGRGGDLLYVSPSFQAITGHDQWAIIGVSARYLLHPADSLWVRRRFLQLISGTDNAARLTYRLRHRDGHYLWLETQFTVVRAADGSLRHVQAASRDVTARREAEIAVARKTDELAKANRLLAIEVQERQELERNILMTIEMELVQVGLELHDELGQDLTGIALMCKSLERRLDEKGWGESVDATRISELVNRTIGHTRMISHGLSPYIGGSDGLVAALTQLISDTNSLGAMECSTELDGGIAVHDEIVARSFYRIAQESINNALKHSRAQRLTLSLVPNEEGIELTISDNGIGHAAADTHFETGGRFHSIRHRCSVIGATLAVRRRKGGGTSVNVIWHPQHGTAVNAASADRVLL